MVACVRPTAVAALLTAVVTIAGCGAASQGVTASPNTSGNLTRSSPSSIVPSTPASSTLTAEQGDSSRGRVSGYLSRGQAEDVLGMPVISVQGKELEMAQADQLSDQVCRFITADGTLLQIYRNGTATRTSMS